MYAVEIHVISWMLAPSSPRMFGSATLTIDESIVAISEPNAIDTATSHLLTGDARGDGWRVSTLMRAMPCRNVVDDGIDRILDRLIALELELHHHLERAEHHPRVLLGLRRRRPVS